MAAAWLFDRLLAVMLSAHAAHAPSASGAGSCRQEHHKRLLAVMLSAEPAEALLHLAPDRVVA